jgi:hypothetical protein
MELILNLAWGFVAALMVWAWVRFVPPSHADRRLQLVALAVLILILFPVISVSDDLMAAQNPAEADCCLRRDHVIFHSNSIIPAQAVMPLPVAGEFAEGGVRLSAPDNLTATAPDHPGLESIENRPPPAA